MPSTNFHILDISTYKTKLINNSYNSITPKVLRNWTNDKKQM